MIIDLKKRCAIVTGGEGAIGSAICRKLSGSGANVVVMGINPEKGEALARELSGADGTDCSYLYGDVTKKDEMIAMTENAMTHYGRIDVLINNAGINVGNEGRKVINRFNENDWHGIIDVDLNGVFYCSRPVVDYMEENGGGRIVNISSVVGQVPVRNTCAFAAAKAGVINLTKAMALELAPKNIAVNCVCPGSVIFEGTRKLYYSDPVQAERMMSHIPMGRPGEAHEIAGAVVFLASDEASYMTGRVMTVDGGWTCGFARDF